MAHSYFQIEKLLIERIREIFENECEVVTHFTFELEEMKKTVSGRKPTFYLFYSGYDAGDDAGFETSKIIRQTWSIVLVIHHYHDKQTAPYRLYEADKHVDKLISGLLGWDFLEQSNECIHSPLKLVNANFPAVNTKEVSLLPFAFETSYPLSRNIVY